MKHCKRITAHCHECAGFIQYNEPSCKGERLLALIPEPLVIILSEYKPTE